MWRTRAANCTFTSAYLVGNHVCIGVAVAAPCAVVMARIDRAVLAERHSGDAAAVDALGLQVGRDSIGPAGAEGDVVFAGAALVGVAFDLHLGPGVLLQPRG